MYKFGLKLWSTNKQYINNAIELFEKEVFQYIELYSVAGSYNDFINYWKNLDIPYIIHGPHSLGGLNLAKKEQRSDNIKYASEAICFADSLKSDMIIFHPGMDGDISETINQIKLIGDSRILIENKPYYSLCGNYVCIGNTAEEIKYILDETNVKFCFDIPHAIYSAQARHTDFLKEIREYFNLNPYIIHISDGDYNDIKDKHLNLGQGNFNFKNIFSFIPKDCKITIETEKNYKNSLNDFEQDVIFIKQFLNKY